MAHQTKRQNNGQTSMDTTMMKIAQRESAEYRRCEKCNRKAAMVKIVNQVGYHVIRCRYCGHTVTY